MFCYFGSAPSAPARGKFYNALRQSNWEVTVSHNRCRKYLFFTASWRRFESDVRHARPCGQLCGMKPAVYDRYLGVRQLGRPVCQWHQYRHSLFSDAHILHPGNPNRQGRSEPLHNFFLLAFSCIIYCQIYFIIYFCTNNKLTNRRCLKWIKSVLILNLSSWFFDTIRLQLTTIIHVCAKLHADRMTVRGSSLVTMKVVRQTDGQCDWWQYPFSQYPFGESFTEW